MKRSLIACVVGMMLIGTVNSASAHGHMNSSSSSYHHYCRPSCGYSGCGYGSYCPKTSYCPQVSYCPSNTCYPTTSCYPTASYFPTCCSAPTCCAPAPIATCCSLPSYPLTCSPCAPAPTCLSGVCGTTQVAQCFPQSTIGCYGNFPSNYSHSHSHFMAMNHSFSAHR